MRQQRIVTGILLLSIWMAACTVTADMVTPKATEITVESALVPVPTDVVVEWDTNPEALIILITACGGEWDPCSEEGYVPEAQIWSDGRLLLVENRDTSNQSQWEGRLTDEQMTKLLQKIAVAGFFGWDEYYEWEPPTDATTRCISVTLKDESKRVCEHYQGAPPDFRALYDYITSGAVASEGIAPPSDEYLAALAALPPTAVVLQYKLDCYEDQRGSTLPEWLPQFTLFADGKAVYREENYCSNGSCQESAMQVQLAAAEAIALLESVRELGFEQLESYTDSCYPMDDGSAVCAIGGSYTTLRMLLPSSTLREVEFSSIADTHLGSLTPIREFLAGYRHLNAQLYRPEDPALFNQGSDGSILTCDTTLTPGLPDPPTTPTPAP